MALKQFQDSIGDINFLDDNGFVYTEGGKYNTQKTQSQWDQRQLDNREKKNQVQANSIINKIAETDKKIAQRDKAFAEAESITNDNPFYSEATRSGRLQKASISYARDRDNLIYEKSTQQDALKAFVDSQQQAYERQFAEKQANKPQLINSKDSRGNTIITAIDPYTGKPINTQSLNDGTPVGTKTAAQLAQEKARAASGASASTTYGPALPPTYGPPAPANNAQQPMAQSMQQPQQPQKPQTGFFQSVFNAIIEPGKKYLGMVGEAGAQAVKSFGGERTALAQKVSNGTASLEEMRKYEQSFAPTFMSETDLEKFSTPARAALETAKRTAGGASYFIPGGTGVKGAIAAGAGVGALSAFSEDDASFGSVAGGAAGGAVGGALLGVAGKAINAVGKGIKGATGAAASSAAARVSKATPTAFERASKFGLDLNELITKHFPVGKTYDDMIGTVGQKGKGGIIAKSIKSSEKVIQDSLKSFGKKPITTASELVRPIEAEIRKLKVVPGYETQVGALQEFVKSTKSMFKKGLNAQDVIDIKRALDSEFGKSIVDESTGSVIAQAQKMLGNNARSILKDTIPAIKAALGEESELYTLRPILERARAIESTQGSAIRKGLSSFDLTKPGTWADPIISNPRVSSVITKLRELNIPDINLGGNAKANYVAERAGSSIPDALTDEKTDTTPQNEFMSQESMTPQASSQQEPEQESESDILRRAIRIDMETTGGEGYADLKKLLDLAESEEKSSGSGKMSSTQVTQLADLESSGATLDNLETAITQFSDRMGPAMGNYYKNNPYDTNAVEFNATMNIVAQNVGKALEGGKLTDEDIDRYRSMLPNILDTPEGAMAKLKVVRSMIQTQQRIKEQVYRQYGGMADTVGEGVQ